ncbi:MULTISPECIES: hypothetical protein [unclassified Methylobacterium]|nr:MULTISPECIES: hypothetical protein [Methylobacterium]WFT79540.1 hypothetical protein QA634_30750 [Methylobacterium nodulans]
MTKAWRSVEQIASARGISVEEARALVQARNCPKVFHGTVTLYLL